MDENKAHCLERSLLQIAGDIVFRIDPTRQDLAINEEERTEWNIMVKYCGYTDYTVNQQFRIVLSNVL